MTWSESNAKFLPLIANQERFFLDSPLNIEVVSTLCVPCMLATGIRITRVEQRAKERISHLKLVSLKLQFTKPDHFPNSDIEDYKRRRLRTDCTQGRHSLHKHNHKHLSKY